MGAFFVGQRVRIVECKYPHLMYVETVITGRSRSHPGWWQLDVQSPMGLKYSILPPEALEPILPEGHRPAELTAEELLPFLREQVSA